MLCIKEIVQNTDIKQVVLEFNKHFNIKNKNKIFEIFNRMLMSEKKKGKFTKVHISSFISSVPNDEYVIIGSDENKKLDVFDFNNPNLYFDISAIVENESEIYSISSAEIPELLGYYIDDETLNKFTFPQIIALIIWELCW